MNAHLRPSYVKNNGEQANECVPRICVAAALLRCRHCGYQPYASFHL